VKTQKKTVTRGSVETTAKAKPVNRVSSTASITVLPSQTEIAQRAYEIYVARGKVGGRELEDWIQAERELVTNGHGNN